MRVPTDLPRRRRRVPRSRIGLAIALGVLVVLLLSLRGLAGFYTDYLWFGELRLTSVWRGVLGAKVVLGLAFTLLFFVILWANLAIADRIAPAFRPAGPEEELVERYHQIVGGRTGLVRTSVAALFALVAGPGVANQWNAWILFRNRVSFGTTDSLFNRDLGFFVFQLPFLKFLVDWLFASVVIVLIVTAVAHYLNGGIRFQTPLQKVTPQVKAHLSVLLGVLALLKAAGYHLQRYELVYSERGVVRGAGYTDVKAQLPALRLLVLISLFACALFVLNIMRRGWVLPLIAVGLWALVSVVVGAAIPALVQRFRVEPSESVRERPYIARNIQATREAFNLGDRHVQVRDFPYDTRLDAAGLAQNEETVRNIRLWDPAVLRRTFKWLQEIRPFYQFNEVDVDRYRLRDGERFRTTQILLAARELRPDGVPSASWVNRHLVYTHGYGAVLAPGNAAAGQGDPQLLVRDLPPQGSPEITQPALYFGQGLGGYAIVNTKQREVDYPGAGGRNQTSTYRGRGGVEMGSALRRVALALRFGDLNPLISGFIGPRSRALYVRDIDERVRKAAPFLRFDSDPYPVLHQGRILWIYDAYTTTNRYPYAEQADTRRLPGGSGLTGSFNYVRNSVKVTIDAYDGTTTFYVQDPDDPVLRSYRRAFPRLFADKSRMPQALQEHLRYPEDLFRVQTNMFGLYHITQPAEFYNRTDAWDIAQEPGSVGGATTVTQVNTQAATVTTREARMDPYYLLMRLPDETSESFLILQPFVPFSRDDSRKDLTAFMVAKSDPENYGKLEAFVMPREQQIEGPALINAKIQQNTDISEKISLLNAPGQGSRVILGNLLIIPVNRSLLYVRPLYVEAEGTPRPQLKRVIVVFGDKVVMRDTLRDALRDVFGVAPATLEEQRVPETAPPGPGPGPGPGAPGPTTTTTPTTAPPPPPVPGDVQGLLVEANRHFEAADNALRQGDLATYKREVDAARDLIRRARGSPAA